MRTTAFLGLGLLLFGSTSALGCSSDDEPGKTNPQSDAGQDAQPDTHADTGAEAEAGVPPDAPTEDVTSEDATEQDAGAPDAAPCTQPDPDAGTGPGGYPLDGWDWVRHGIVIEDPGAGAQGGFIAPAAWVLDDTLHLWITRKEGTLHRIFHCSSTDGVTFSQPVETSGLEGENIIAYPSVLHDGSRFLMWYGSGSIDHARSDDGVSWTMIENGVLRPGEAGTFDSLSLLYPDVVATGSGYVMHYTGFDGQSFRIGRALSSDGVVWERSPALAVLEKGGADDFDNHAVAQPRAFVAGSRTLLWYGGYDTSVANPGPYRIGLAEAPDGESFERKGVTLDLEPSGTEAWSTRDPAVVRWKGKWWMAYVAMGDDAVYRIALASSETCVPQGR